MREDGQPEQPDTMSKAPQYLVFGCLILLVGFAVLTHLAFRFNWLGLKAYKMGSGVMEPTIPEGGTVMTNTEAYKNKSPERFDVVVYAPPGMEDVEFVGRIIALPGETIQLSPGQILIEGQLINAPGSIQMQALSQNPQDALYAVSKPHKVGENAVFIVGDRIDNVRDSRVFGDVPISSLRAKALID